MLNNNHWLSVKIYCCMLLQYFVLLLMLKHSIIIRGSEPTPAGTDLCASSGGVCTKGRRRDCRTCACPRCFLIFEGPKSNTMQCNTMQYRPEARLPDLRVHYCIFVQRWSCLCNAIQYNAIQCNAME